AAEVGGGERVHPETAVVVGVEQALRGQIDQRLPHRRRGHTVLLGDLLDGELPSRLEQSGQHLVAERVGDLLPQGAAGHRGVAAAAGHGPGGSLVAWRVPCTHMVSYGHYTLRVRVRQERSTAAGAEGIGTPARTGLPSGPGGFRWPRTRRPPTGRSPAPPGPP